MILQDGKLSIWKRLAKPDEQDIGHPQHFMGRWKHQNVLVFLSSRFSAEYFASSNLN